MGSHIEVDSVLGGGSTFRFALSFKRDTTLTPPAVADSALGALDGLATFEGAVLVVEDNPVNRILALEMLQSLGLDVIEADYGAQALELLTQHPVDLVLMDCQMPVLDGYTATQRIREREAQLKLPRVPIVAMTANAFDEDAAQALAVGMDGHLAKPYTRDQLRDALEPCL